VVVKDEGLARVRDDLHHGNSSLYLNPTPQLDFTSHQAYLDLPHRPS